MRAAALALLFAGCLSWPDRYTVTGGRGEGGLETANGQPDRDFEENYLEVGLSGPIGTQTSAPARAEAGQWSPPPAAGPTPPTTAAQPPQQEIPWDLLIGALLGAGGLVGGQKGHRMYKSRTSKKA